jgi:predicted MFS family arabinose efflux permease
VPTQARDPASSEGIPGGPPPRGRSFLLTTAVDRPTNNVPRRPNGGLIALGLAVGPAVALGLARFAYALLLPPMREALHWSYTTAGAMNTANALGYLLGAMTAAPLARWYGARGIFIGGIAIIAVALLASAATGNIIVLLILRVLAGIAGAACFVVGAALTARLSQDRAPGHAALLLGIYFAGGGLGITISGLTISPVLALTNLNSGWRWGWILLAAVTLLALLAAIPAARATPELASAPTKAAWPARRLTFLFTAYGLFGTGYIAYMTFIVAFLKTHGAPDAEVTAFWSVLGIAAIGGGFVWGPFLSRQQGGRGPAALMAVVTAGAALPLLSTSTQAAFGSAVIFGVSFLAVITAVTTVARVSLHPYQWTAAIAALTTAFAIGQCLGPVFAGVLSDRSDGVRSGLLLSVAILATGALVALLQPSRTPQETNRKLPTAPNLV